MHPYTYVAIMPGRFQPPHIGHMQAFQWLSEKFDVAYIATSNKVEAERSPFNFEEKHAMFTYIGIPDDKVVMVKSPYIATEIVSQYDKETTIVVFGVSQKDMNEDPRFSFALKKDGTNGYFLPYADHIDNLQPQSKHAYIYVVPTFDFTLAGHTMTSATEFRVRFALADQSEQCDMVAAMFGKYDLDIHQLLKSRIF